MSTARLLALATKYEERYGKSKLLDRYLNMMYFGRAAGGSWRTTAVRTALGWTTRPSTRERMADVKAEHEAAVDLTVGSTGKIIDLGKQPMNSNADVLRSFGYEVAFGQYPITVLDHANGAATFAARGQRATAHFVASVSRTTLSRGPASDAAGQIVKEETTTRSMGLTDAQLDDLTWVMSQTAVAKLPDGRASAALTGTWPLANTSQTGDAWITGFTPQLAMAVWVGSRTLQRPLVDRDNQVVTGATLPAQIYRGFMAAALAGTPATAFRPPAFCGDDTLGDARR
jgi:membrane peptidoglycan carboxypeptidase